MSWRVDFFADARRVFILLHGIIKRSARLPEEDIRIAESRMQIHNHRLERS